MVFAFLRPEELVFGTLRNLQKIAQTEDLKASRERILHMVDRTLSWEGELTLDYTPVSRLSPLVLVREALSGRDLGVLQIMHVLSVCGFRLAPPELIKMCNIAFAVAVQSAEIDRRLCLVELGIGRDDSIVLLVQSTSCGHLFELFACWDAFQHL
jgi:hypothetical protein